jgi:hypothetical protein
MQTYNINPVVQIIADQEVSVISLGEQGRGRKYKLIKCPKNFTNLSVVAPKPGMPGNVRLVETEDNKPGLIMRVCTHSSYVRGANGNVSVHPDHIKNVEVITAGQGAFGAAGRTGTWDDLLLVVTGETVLRVKPSRGDAYILRVNEDFTVQRLTYAEAEVLEVDTLSSSTTSRGEFIRLSV